MSPAAGVPSREDQGTPTEEVSGVSAGRPDDELRSGRRRSRRGLPLAYLVTVLVLITVNFFLPRAMPGDPIAALMEPGTQAQVSSEVLREQLASYYGLDQPITTQYLSYLGDLAHGELGTSIRFRRPVAELVGERLPWTLLLVVTAMAIATVVGVLAGTHSGWRRGERVDRGLLAVFLGFRNFPVFFLASLAALVFAVYLDWVPLSGAATPFAQGLGPLARAADVAHHLVLPATVLATQFAAGYFLLMRAGVVGELGSDHLRLGRAKGLRQRRLKYHYAGRNALLPVVTLMAVHVSHAVTGAVFVETVFAYPGMGRLVFEAVEFRDYPVLQASFLVLTVFVLTANFLADLSYRRLDPRTAA